MAVWISVSGKQISEKLAKAKALPVTVLVLRSGTDYIDIPTAAEPTPGIDEWIKAFLGCLRPSLFAFLPVIGLYYIQLRAPVPAVIQFIFLNNGVKVIRRIVPLKPRIAKRSFGRRHGAWKQRDYAEKSKNLFHNIFVAVQPSQSASFIR